MRLHALALGSLALGLGVTPALADPISLTVMTGPMLQQTTNRPCVIGDPSCHNPASLPYTLLAPQDSADVVSSPEYTVDQIRALVGDTFSVGIDLNQARGHDDGNYMLNSFTLTANGAPLFATTGPVTLTPLSPGNGFSDALVTGFNLSGLAGSTTLRFTTNFAGGSAGREQYFLRSGAQTSSPTPEPGTWLLLGTGALAVIRRKAQLH